MDSSVIQIPHDWIPRQYQIPLVSYLEDGGKRAVAVWHRRAGKDTVALNMTAAAAVQRVGTYWHMLPQQAQARKVIWDGINRHGKRMIDQAFPEGIRESYSNQEMKIQLANGSIWQLCGSDNFDSLVGSNPVGVVFSEFSIAKPECWDFIRPILAENGGWALFIYTPRGKNHAYTLYEKAKMNPNWYSEILTVEDTNAIPIQAVEEERESGMSEEMIRQEFYCSFHGISIGKRVYPEFHSEYHISDEPLLPLVYEGVKAGKNRVVVRGWDNTGLNPACVLTYVNSLGQWYIFREFCGDDIGIVEFGEMIQTWCGQNLPGATVYRDYGDPAGRVRDTTKQSPADYLKQHCSISIQDGIQTFKIRRESVARRLEKQVSGGEPALLVDPKCQMLIEGFEGGYAYTEIGTTGVFRTDPQKNQWSHPHDGLQYAATRLFQATAKMPPQRMLYPEILGHDGY